MAQEKERSRWGTWLLLAAIAAVTVGGCAMAPQVGWAGWLFFIGAYYIAHRIEKNDEEARERIRESTGRR